MRQAQAMSNYQTRQMLHLAPQEFSPATKCSFLSCQGPKLCCLEVAQLSRLWVHPFLSSFWLWLQEQQQKFQLSHSNPTFLARTKERGSKWGELGRTKPQRQGIHPLGAPSAAALQATPRRFFIPVLLWEVPGSEEKFLIIQVCVIDIQISS